MAVLATVLCASVACSASSGGFPAPTGDGGSTDTPKGGSDPGMGADATPVVDRPLGTDGASADRMTPGDTGGGGAFGTCGMATRQALCACGMNATCQTNAVNRNMACAQCVVMAQIACCPMQADALQNCAQTNMCSDLDCVQANCMRQINALQTCFASAQMNDMACQSAMAGCFGEFPFACE